MTKKFTDAEIEQHRIELANALIEHADEQIVGSYATKEGVCAVGCALNYTGLYVMVVPNGEELNKSFEEYFGIPHDEVVGMNEISNINPNREGPALQVLMTFPQIADAIKNWEDEYDPSAE
jgi:PAS domain-containing protein